jgi:tetratricopeptide (TPR) repeat protein
MAIKKYMHNDWQELRRLSSSANVKGDLRNAIVYLIKSIQEAEHHAPSELALMLNSLAKYYQRINDISSAEEAAKRSLRMELEFGGCGAHNTKLASYHMMLAQIFEVQSRFSEALEHIDKAVTIFTKHHESQDPFLKNLREYRDTISQNVWRG